MPVAYPKPDAHDRQQMAELRPRGYGLPVGDQPDRYSASPLDVLVFLAFDSEGSVNGVDKENSTLSL